MKEMNTLTLNGEQYEIADKKAREDIIRNKSAADAEIAKKADKSYVDDELAKKANQTDMDTALGLKADKTYVDSQNAAQNTEISKKANQTDMDTALAGKSPNIDDNQASTDHPWSGYKSKKYVDDKIQEIIFPETPKTWSDWQKVTRDGFAGNFVHPGDQFSVERVKDATAEAEGTGISGASVDKIKFIKCRNEAKTGKYTFNFIDGKWYENNEPVSITDMGINVEGSPVQGDSIIVAETTEEIIFDVAGVDYDVPADPNYTHSITLLAHNCVDNCVFDQPELLWVCTKESHPDGLPAGTYNITLNHGTYHGGTDQDGTYQFTTGETIPVGGGIRHSSMGGYQSSYNKGQITSGKISTYGASGESIETGLAVSEGAEGTNLGTASARDMQYVTGDCWLTEIQYYGNNDGRVSAIAQYLNSDKESGWWKKQHAFDMPQTSPTAGFLYGLDPAFLAVIGEVKKRTALFKIRGEDPKFFDNSEKVWLPSMTEVGFGANDGVWETPLVDGAPKQEPLPLFENATDADRIKYLSGSARWWWLRGARPWDANNVRFVSTGGSLNNNYAYYGSGAVPGLCII